MSKFQNHFSPRKNNFFDPIFFWWKVYIKTLSVLIFNAIGAFWPLSRRKNRQTCHSAHRALYLKETCDFVLYHKIGGGPPHPQGGFDTKKTLIFSASKTTYFSAKKHHIFFIFESKTPFFRSPAARLWKKLHFLDNLLKYADAAPSINPNPADESDFDVVTGLEALPM